MYTTVQCIRTYSVGGRIHVHAPRRDLGVCSKLSYDIYFIGVSLPSSMMIYNCCPLNCNYYNYRFFVGLSHPSFEPEPAASFRSIPFRTSSTPLVLRLLFSRLFLLVTSHVSPFLSIPCLSCFSTRFEQRGETRHTYIHMYMRMYVLPM